MKIKIAVLAGDGIGPEVIQEALKCLQAVEETFGHQFTFVEAPIGAIAIENHGTPLPDKTIEICKNADAILFGAIGDRKYDNSADTSIRPEQGLLSLRKKLGLFANIRPITIPPSLLKKSPIKPEFVENTDFILYRELCGGVYFGNKVTSEDGLYASDLCAYTEKEISRIAHLAFKAAKNRKQKVTLVDKANVMASSRLWRKVVTKISKSYPEVLLNYIFVDDAAMQLIRNPKQFDVILTENLFGDILADEASIITGALGVLSSASIGEGVALFEPAHGSLPEAAGQNKVNPVGTILASAMLLAHFGLKEEAIAIRKAVEKSILKKIVTPDLNNNSTYGTSHIGDFIANNIMDSDEHFTINDENIDLGKSTII